MNGYEEIMHNLKRKELVMNAYVDGIPADRLRAGSALSTAIKEAIDKRLIHGYADIAAHMGFNRTNIAHHKNGIRPMSRLVVLNYATLLQCEPAVIADDKIRAELNKDLERLNGDSNAYAVLKEYGKGAKKTPVKLAKDVLADSGVDAEQLAVVRIGDGDELIAGCFVIVCEDPLRPVVSGQSHVLINKHTPYIAQITICPSGYIITPEDGSLASYQTLEELTLEGVRIIGPILWRMIKEHARVI